MKKNEIKQPSQAALVDGWRKANATALEARENLAKVAGEFSRSPFGFTPPSQRLRETVAEIRCLEAESAEIAARHELRKSLDLSALESGEGTERASSLSALVRDLFVMREKRDALALQLQKANEEITARITVTATATAVGEAERQRSNLPPPFAVPSDTHSLDGLIQACALALEEVPEGPDYRLYTLRTEERDLRAGIEKARLEAEEKQQAEAAYARAQAANEKRALEASQNDLAERRQKANAEADEKERLAAAHRKREAEAKGA